MTLSLAFEILVSLLLIITIGYCFMLDRRLKALRNGQDGVRSSILELVQATGQAEQSVQALRETGDKISLELEAQIMEAKRLSKSLQPTGNKPDRISSIRPKTTPEPASPHSSGLMDRLKRAG
ncbi:hypothetical protein MNBD_ALPHA06-834 [hydrothermal vent metagenome]|uniref:DUF6468 domain-containing protein n=1 Tax=hydrothermal vent metagenome TaxID=652676 RepID=A0A3B0RCC4_9ZZZZ